MKARMSLISRDESGKILIMALILLVVGALLLTPLLGLMSTGLIAGQVYERKTAELYAADAGVEDAIWKIQNRVPDSYPYDYPELLNVNGKSVEVMIARQEIGIKGSCHIEYRYDIQSIARGLDGSSTTVEASLSVLYPLMDYSGIMDNVIVSRCDYDLQGPSNVDPDEGEEHGPVRYYDGAWPTAEFLSSWYLSDVDGYDYDGGYLIDLAGSDMELGPLLIDNGENRLRILNSVNQNATVTLKDTLYITGETWIGQTGHDITINLNGQAIFVESDTGAAPEDDPCNPGNQYALRIGGKVTITGSGVIIAVGNIEMKPNFDGSPEDYLLVMSVLGETSMQPTSGSFYGTLAGTSEVHLQNANAEWTDPAGRELNFPMGEESKYPDVDALPIDELSIISWQIK